MTVHSALVGCGGMGLRHAHGYLELRKHSDEVKMVAVCDLYESSANHVASAVEEATGDRPNVYTDFDRMLAEQKPLDAIDIVTDTRMHHVFAVKALDAGVNVMTEKPMGITIRACQIMRAAAERSGKVLSVAENYRRDPMNRLAKALIDGGAIGEPYFIYKAGLGGGSALMHDTAWRGLKTRGGYLIDGGVHDGDLLLYFMGDVETIYAQTGLFTPVRTRIPLGGDIGTFYRHRTEDLFAGAETVEIDQEDTAFATLRFTSGAIGNYSSSNASHGYSVGVNTVHGSIGTIQLPPSRSGIGPVIHLEGRDDPIKGDDLLELVPDWELDDITAPFWDGARRITSYERDFRQTDRKIIGLEYLELARAIETGSPVEVGPELGMKALAVSYGTLESGASGEPVRMSQLLEGEVEEYQAEINEAAGL